MSGRKPRRPRWLPTAETMKLASHRAGRLSQAEVAEVMQPLRQAFRALREGVATEWQWSIAASAVNAAKAIEDQGVVKGLRGHLHTADHALQAIYTRAQAADAWRPTPLYWHEIDAIHTAVDLHQFQLEQLAHGEALRAIDKAAAEIRSTGGRVVALCESEAA